MFKAQLIGAAMLSREMETKLAQVVREVGEEVFIDAKQNTPVKSGNARKNWTKKISPDTFVVENKVPYIERLEAGASKQAPKGIIGPTLDQVKGKL